MKKEIGQLSDSSVKLSCRNLWKLYGPFPERFAQESQLRQALNSGREFTALRDINLDIRHGEIFVVMGLSGSGKSTLLRCLTRLVEPSFGEVLLDGAPLTSLDAQGLMNIRRHKMAMVFQNFALLPHLTVAENIGLPLKIRGSDTAEINRVVPEMTALVGLSGMSQRLPHQLSGGQQQRVGLARALAGDPELLFLDEPFSALDPLIRRELQGEVIRLQSRLKKTMIFVTHDFNEAVRLGDTIVIMKDGKVVQTGAPEDIVANPIDDYVGSFVAGVDQTRVISCGRIAIPAKSSAYAVTVDDRAKIVEVADLVANSNGPVGVVDQSGHVSGEIDATTVLRMLASGSRERLAS
ncbi:ATP-binding cassette domain-containing protein [Hyphomicrobium facile]|uniref:Glycine betaine/proline transport system ATP-binding protein n=1 Tax=Hyphomicrobium facile TaxID=51670 RepID=A0A1I7N597_9HYPH|nr:ATP-binding cassette domain-containing protein [Hyphomicrobium facile]SFV29753.1 glycine betaine/proline transport system ATP-binding protein [Hyphomicrobium facile]